MTQFRTRAFCVTCFDLTEEYLTYFKDLSYKYLIIGDETCPKTKKKHLQIYIYFTNAKSLKSAIKVFKPHHVECAKGDATENRNYCSKEFILYEDGVLPKKGERTDIEECRNIAKDTSRIREVVLSCTSFQGLRIAEKYLEYFETARTWKPNVYWIHGPSGCGKSKQAYFMSSSSYKSDQIYTCMDSIKWFQGYDGQPCVILDDFRSDYAKFHSLLKLIDRYPYRVEMKGGSRQFLARDIYITSIYSPYECYKNTNEPIQQLLRRIDSIVNLTPKTDSDSDSD